MNNKELIVYLDDSYKSEKNVVFTYDETKKLLLSCQNEIVKTTSLSTLSFDWYRYGYKLYLVRNNIKIEIYPGMDVPNGKDIKETHNLLRLTMGGLFDELFIK